MQNCSNCGAIIPDDVQFCPVCGKVKQSEGYYKPPLAAPPPPLLLGDTLSSYGAALVVELFPKLLEGLVERDWQELHRRLKAIFEDEQWPEIEFILNCYSLNRPTEYLPCYNAHVSQLTAMLIKLQHRGDISRFAKIVFDIRPDIAKKLGIEQRRTVPAPPPPPVPAAPPPSLAAPPAPIVRTLILFILVGLAALVGASFLLTRTFGGGRILFLTQMTLLTIGVCLVPTIAHRLTNRRGRVRRVLLETTLFIALLLSFSVWLFGKKGFGVWVAYAVGLTLLLEAGSNLIERYIGMTLKRIFRNASFKNLQADAEAIQRMFRGELVLYVPIPVGLAIGTIVGLIGNWTALSTITFCIQLVLSLASIVLAVFLILAFARMSDPLFRESPVASTRITEESLTQKKGILSSLGKVFRFLVPPPQANEDIEQKDLSLAHMITDLRKVYLYDSVHNIILLVAFALIVVSLRNLSVGIIKWVVAAFLGLILIFSQLPFIIGQSLLHEKVLDRYDGVKRADMADKLKKTAPVFPTVDFLASLFATGTAGGLIYFLLDQFVKNVLK